MSFEWNKYLFTFTFDDFLEILFKFALNMDGNLTRVNEESHFPLPELILLNWDGTSQLWNEPWEQLNFWQKEENKDVSNNNDSLKCAVSLLWHAAFTLQDASLTPVTLSHSELMLKQINGFDFSLMNVRVRMELVCGDAAVAIDQSLSGNVSVYMYAYV